jgi:hypothetical protein
MPLPTQLIDLRLRLESVGMIIVEEPDHLNVRLPFFCSVRVYSDGDHLRFESYFGVVGRVKSTVLKLGATTVLAFASAHYGIGYAGALALLAVVAGIYDSIRWQVTEHAITRISTIASLVAVADMPGRRPVASGSSHILRSTESSTIPADRVFVRDRRDD